MAAEHKSRRVKLEPSGFFVLRTPLLPFDDFLAWSDGLEAGRCLSDAVELEKAIARDRQLLRRRLYEIYARPELREALFVASPHLDESFEIWKREPESERGRGIELALVRYFARMAGRATPFGLCAGCSLGLLGKRTHLELPEQRNYQRHTRLDMDYLQALCEALARDATVRNTLRYSPNSSLFRAAGRLHYLESRVKDESRSYHLIAIDESESLTETLKRAKDGAQLSELAAALVEDEISLSDAEEYIGELIENQILVPAFALCVTGAEPLGGLVAQFASSAETAALAETLREVGSEVSAFDRNGLRNSPEAYRAVAHRLESLPAKVELSRVFQVDMIKPAPGAMMGEAVVHEIVRGVELLHRLSRDDALSHRELKHFREAFVQRYETREVPLAEALDAEAGIGFPLPTDARADGSPLLRGLDFPPLREETARWGAREKFLLRKLGHALQSGAEEIILQTQDLEGLSSANPLPLPDAFSVTGAIATASDAALARGDFRIFLHGTTGPSGARFLGRFCHADSKLQREVQRHLKAEEALQPEAIFAEVVHLPEGRIGNVLARPILREHEIIYLGNAGSAAECRIPLSDLRVSVRGERIILRSARLEREVIPRLTSAHNFNGSSVSLYRFLCLLQGQSLADQLGWSWGALRDASFLPRVVSGRIVLSRAFWRVQEDEVKPFRACSGAALFRAVNDWRMRRRIPRIVLLAEADNELPIDFGNVLSVETFVSLVKAREQASLVEMFPGPDGLCARGPEGHFVHEFIIPFIRKTEGESTTKLRPVTAEAPATIRRTFPPGSEWIYAKLYTGSATADYVLRKVVRPLTAAAHRGDAIDRWFFIRYADPQNHLRLRLHGDPERLQNEVLPLLEATTAPLLEDGRIWRLQFDTYERELERYGGVHAITLAERIFHIDSEAVLGLIERLEPGDAGLNERWRLTLRGIDLLLHDFELNGQAKLALLRKLRTTFAREFHANVGLQRQIGERFRKERKDLERLLHPGLDAENELSVGIGILRERSKQLAPLLQELRRCETAGGLTNSLADIAQSLIHMHANRLLRSAHRAHELVLYEFLVRLYTPRNEPED